MSIIRALFIVVKVDFRGLSIKNEVSSEKKSKEVLNTVRMGVFHLN